MQRDPTTTMADAKRRYQANPQAAGNAQPFRQHEGFVMARPVSPIAPVPPSEKHEIEHEKISRFTGQTFRLSRTTRAVTDGIPGSVTRMPYYGVTYRRR